MKVKQFEGITYEEHHNIMFGDYVKISLHDWQSILDFIQDRMRKESTTEYKAGYQDGFSDGQEYAENNPPIRPNY